ncbi:MAG: hypothetical protein ABIW84_01805, partial [Ilumatobacteraceae bacterium]
SSKNHHMNRHAHTDETSYAQPDSEVRVIPEEHWGELDGLRKLCIRLEATDLLDLDFWKKIDALTDGTEVYYDDQLRRYIAWCESKTPSRRHKNRRRGFMNWIREDISRDQWRRRNKVDAARR